MITSTQDQSLQQRYAPNSICFGCGPANEKGLKINSYIDGEEVVAEWLPSSHHEAFPGMLNGGIIGSLLDCHCNWTAAWYIGNQMGVDEPPCTVTANYSVQLKRPTPSNKPVSMRAKVLEFDNDRAKISAELVSGGKVCATCEGLFVAVKPGHPAYHRWG